MTVAFRFRKSIKLFPGVKINLSKSGVSTSVGVPGATVNLKPGRSTRITNGIPGTGLSVSQSIVETDTPHQQIAVSKPLFKTVALTVWSAVKLVGTIVLIVGGVFLSAFALFSLLGGSEKPRRRRKSKYSD